MESDVTTRIKRRIRPLLWGPEPPHPSRWQRTGVRTLRLLYAVLRDLRDGQLTLRAMSLVYTTLLSLVPLLALSFSVLKAFGVHNQIRPALLTVLQPLGGEGERLADVIIGFVANMQVGVLGAIGLGLLVYTVVALLQKIETTFNYVWRVAQMRPVAQRFSQYLSVLTVGPIVVFATLGAMAALFEHRIVGRVSGYGAIGGIISGIGWLVPSVLTTMAFTFMYSYMPNTRVRLGPALTGAVVAALLWQSVGWGFATFVAGSAKYTAVYAGFAIVIVGMIWVYVGWLIVLIGASLAFYTQNPAYLGIATRDLELSIRGKEALGLRVLAWIGRSFREGKPACTIQALAERMAVPSDPVSRVVSAFVKSGILAETADDPPAYLPARALESVTVKEMLATIRNADGNLTPARVVAAPDATSVHALLDQVEAAGESALGECTLDDLARITGSSDITA